VKRPFWSGRAVPTYLVLRPQAATLNCRRKPLTDACFGTACNILQAKVAPQVAVAPRLCPDRHGAASRTARSPTRSRADAAIQDAVGTGALAWLYFGPAGSRGEAPVLPGHCPRRRFHHRERPPGSVRRVSAPAGACVRACSLVSIMSFVVNAHSVGRDRNERHRARGKELRLGKDLCRVLRA
jgi:hypothetical protein